MRPVGSIPMHFRHFNGSNNWGIAGSRTSVLLTRGCTSFVRISAIRGVRVLRCILRHKCAAFCAAFTGRTFVVGISDGPVVLLRHERAVPQPSSG